MPRRQNQTEEASVSTQGHVQEPLLAGTSLLWGFRGVSAVGAYGAPAVATFSPCPFAAVPAAQAE